MEREPSTGISILVVGGGIAGFTLAIEAYRKGHDVRVVERRPQGEYSGEIIMITTSALRTPEKWPGFLERARKAGFSPNFVLCRFDGTVLGEHSPGDPNFPSISTYRRKLHNLLYEYATDLGIRIDFEVNVREYLETPDHGGVVLANGERLTADVVVAADGVGSKSRLLVDPSNQDAPVSSGFIMYRVAFPIQPAMEKDALIAEYFADYPERGFLYVGPGAHLVLSKTFDDVCWLLTCKDNDPTATESWSRTTSTSRALEAVKGWHPLVHAIINATPNHQVLDWKLMWRDPQPKWASDHGRVIQIGDAAHPFLPTSFSGGTMAMEDAYTLAECLRQGGREGVIEATNVFNKLRFERVSCAQKLGFKNREVFHSQDWAAPPEDTSHPTQTRQPEKPKKMVGDWLVRHDPELYARDNYEMCKRHLVFGTPFENTNAVPGYKYKPWTVKELLERSEKGEPDLDEGEWS